MRTREILQSVDWVLAGAVFLLVGVSLAMLFSSTYTVELFSSRFLRQALAAGVGLGIGFIILRIPYHSWQRYALPIYGVAVGALVAVYFAGQVIRGTASRFEFGDFQVQPSEFVKIALIIALAWLLASRDRLGWRGVVLSGLLVLIPSGLILLEPDLGVAALLLALWGMLLIFRGLPWLAVFALGVAGSLGFAAAWFWMFADYQRERLLVFLDPTRDPFGAGYNILQSIVAFGSGRLLGRGLGHGPQSQLEFLPERHTDFILSSIGEELGFVGVVVVLALYAIVLWRILRIARSTQDGFGQLLAVGTFVLLLTSLVVSAGMNMGLLPVTGIPLPLLSYGGSNLVSTFVLLAIVESVRVYSKWVQASPTEITHLT